MPGTSGVTAEGPPTLAIRLVASRVAILAQEELQFIRRNLECRDQAAEHVANAVGGQVAFHEEPLVDLEGFAE